MALPYLKCQQDTIYYRYIMDRISTYVPACQGLYAVHACIDNANSETF